VIQIATHNSAVFLGKADQMGSIDVGQRADMVLLGKDPTVDIHNTKSILFVMKDGHLVDESQLPLAGGKQPRRFNP
jgi:imidazolonepropionase-like amidohydrolase